MMNDVLSNMAYGFSVALQWQNIGWCLLGVLIGNLVGVLPGLGVLSAISILLPLTYHVPHVGAVLMLAGIYYGAQYGGAICSILLNLPCHPPHAVTCLDGFPMTKQGKGGTALGITMLGSFFGASFGIVQMMFLAPLLVAASQKFGAAEICSLMLLGLLAGSTLSRGSPLKGVAMTVLGLALATVGNDPQTGQERFNFGIAHMYEGFEIVAIALGLFGIAEFLKTVNRMAPINSAYTNVKFKDLWPSRADFKQGAMPAFRGTLIGSLCSLIPGVGPTIASFIAYATEKKISKTPERFGHGAIEGVACPEAATHSSVQGDFIPTMSLGIPGDAVMALLLSALIIHNIQPGPQLVTQHPDVFWGLIASFWIGNIMLMVLNMPMIGLWVKLLTIPYKFLYPAALFFICIGTYSVHNSMFGVMQTLGVGLVGIVLMQLGFQPAPVLLGFVLGKQLEETFRRAMTISRGDLGVFVDVQGHWISTIFLALSVILIGSQIYFAFFKKTKSNTFEGLPSVGH
jgi:putative tricarboxylic transport membrane protein